MTHLYLTVFALSLATVAGMTPTALASSPLIYAALSGQEGFMCRPDERYVEGCSEDLICDQNRHCRDLWSDTYRALWASEAAYHDLSPNKRAAVLAEVGLHERFYKNWDGFPDAEALIADNSDIIVVALAGTDSILDIRNDVATSLVNPHDVYDAGWMPCRIASPIGCNLAAYRVHKGFLRYAHDAYWGFIQVELPKLLREKSRPVQIVGHSLGGAAAQLLAVQILIDLGIEIDSVVTFGSPKVGDDGWRANYERFLHRATHRWVFEDDPVPNLPLHSVYKRAGQQHYIDQVIRLPQFYLTYELDSTDHQMSFADTDFGDHSLLGSYMSAVDGISPCDHPWRQSACN